MTASSSRIPTITRRPFLRRNSAASYSREDHSRFGREFFAGKEKTSSYTSFSAQLLPTMTFSNSISDQVLLGLGVIFVLSSIVILAVNKRQRDAVLERLHFRRRRASGASTPPRSFSPSKKEDISTTTKQTLPSTISACDYVNTFPPSRRTVLPELAATASGSDQKIFMGPDPSVDFLLKDPLPTTRSYDLENDVPKYTPTGFSTAEIKAMGDFPAYDVLSGVPLPEAYENFEPSKALPRPYRPFRWAYHQTMCKLLLSRIKY